MYQLPDALLALPPEEIAARVFVRGVDLPEGVSRVPLKEVHTNRCPALVQWNHLRPADLERLEIEPAKVLARAAEAIGVSQSYVSRILRETLLASDEWQAASQAIGRWLERPELELNA